MVEWLEVLTRRIFPSGSRRLIEDRYGHSLRLDRSQAGAAKGVLAMLENRPFVVTVLRSWRVIMIMLMVMTMLVSCGKSGSVSVVGIKTFDGVELDNQKEAAELKAEENHHTQGNYSAIAAVASFLSMPHKHFNLLAT